mgnify:CR=1 FL=1
MTKDELEIKVKELEQEINTLVSSNSDSQAELTITMNELAKAKEELKSLKQQPTEVYELKAKVKNLELKEKQVEKLAKLLAMREKQLNALVEYINGLMTDKKSQLQLDASLSKYQNNEFENMINSFNEEVNRLNKGE